MKNKNPYWTEPRKVKDGWIIEKYDSDGKYLGSQTFFTEKLAWNELNTLP